MEPLFVFLFFILGLIVGSFINVWVLRLGNGIGRYERSKCLSCGYGLGFWDLIPVLSFLFLGGRCRKCKTKISIQYPIVELLTGLSFVLILFRGGFVLPATFGAYWINTIIMILIVVPMIGLVVYDIKHRIVPNQMALPFIVFGIIFGLFSFFAGLDVNIPDIIAGVLLFVPFLVLWLVSRGRWIGMGDIMLIFGIGAMLGFMGGISAILIAFWSATLFLIIFIIPALYLFDIRLFNVQKGSIMKSEIPLVPFLALGTFLVLVFDWNIISLFI